MSVTTPGEGNALPRMRLDDLLDELQVHIQVVRSKRERVNSLLEAVLAVGSDLDLEVVLRRIVESATALSGAKYGALGILGDDGMLARFLTVGVDEETIARIGPYPMGHGILGLLISEPRPLRLLDLTNHPEAFGFPPGHPPMRTFLGVPVRTRTEVFGHLYLTEKQGGEFDEDDEVLMRTLAAAAGVAVENARLYDDARRRERWLSASSELTRSLLSGTDPSVVLHTFAGTVRRMADADRVTIALPVQGRDHLVVEAADGEGAEAYQGLVQPMSGTTAGKVFTTNEPFTAGDPVSGAADAGGQDGREEGPGFLLPLGTVDQVRGVLHVAGQPGRPPFSEGVREMVAAFAGQAALALEIAERRRDAELLTVLQDRDRIARDLHDMAIQRLFATGMSLQSVTRLIDHPDALAKVNRAVDDLDETIKVIRGTIFSLRVRDRGDRGGVRARMLGEVDRIVPALGFAPALRMDGLLDTLVDDHVAEHLLAVLREALSNTARHARATRVEIAADAGDGAVRLRITDNGDGPAAGGERRSGLANLAARADELGGRFEFGPGPDGGTVVRWEVPIDEAPQRGPMR